jgi:hypothetical protein
VRDDVWEIAYWQRLFDWERASFVAYPGWWSGGETRNPILDLESKKDEEPPGLSKVAGEDLNPDLRVMSTSRRTVVVRLFSLLGTGEDWSGHKVARVEGDICHSRASGAMLRSNIVVKATTARLLL